MPLGGWQNSGISVDIETFLLPKDLSFVIYDTIELQTTWTKEILVIFYKYFLYRHNILYDYSIFPRLWIQNHALWVLCHKFDNQFSGNCLF